MVYIDNTNIHNGYYRVSNMLADTPDELYAMADAIGLKRAWEKHDGEFYRGNYFEVALSKKAKALKLGAIEVSVAEMMAMFPAPDHIQDEQLNLAELCIRYKDQPCEYLNEKEVLVCVDGVVYLMPVYCIPDFFGIEAKEATVEGIKEMIAHYPETFKSFILL